MPVPATLKVIDRAEDAALLLQPERRRILELLATPDSASGLARRLQLSRQIVSYHLRELERTGLVMLEQERRRGNCVERVMRRAASAYMIGPTALGALAADPAKLSDKLSSAYQVAVAARTIREISRMSREAETYGKTLPTLMLETEIRFRNARERDAFTREITAELARLIRKYHDAKCPGGRRFRFLSEAYPMPDQAHKHGKEK